MDYELEPAVLTFPVGSAQGARQCVTVTINDDVAVEIDENFHMRLTSTDARLQISSICSRATFTIVDTDGKIVIIIGHYPYTIKGELLLYR